MEEDGSHQYWETVTGIANQQLAGELSSPSPAFMNCRKKERGKKNVFGWDFLFFFCLSSKRAVSGIFPKSVGLACNIQLFKRPLFEYERTLENKLKSDWMKLTERKRVCVSLVCEAFHTDMRQSPMASHKIHSLSQLFCYLRSNKS